MESYRIVFRKAEFPVVRSIGGYASSGLDDEAHLELWNGHSPPTRQEWELANLEAAIARIEPISGDGEIVVFQKTRSIKLGSKTLEFGWKDLLPPKYI